MRIAYWLWDNPALHREWSGQSGQGRRRTALGEAVAWLGLVVLLAVYGAAAWWLCRPERNPWQARSFLLTACVAYFALVHILVPGPAAGAISGERERETWQGLLLTALRPSQIVAAKYVAALRPAGALLLGFLPVLLPTAHAARLPFTHFLPLVLVLVLAPAGVAALALWLSGRFRRTRVAGSIAYVVVALGFWAALIWFGPWAVRGENFWWYLSPVWQAAVLCLAEPLGSPLARPLLPEWAWFALLSVALTAACLGLLTRRIAWEESA